MSKKDKKNVNCAKQYKAKKFRVAKAGATTDGRKISREWVEQMATNYDPKKYGARINLEHFKGIFPDGPFKAYGDVLGLTTEEEGGELYLVAELSPTDALVELNKKRQKVYTSIEVDTEFSDTGEAYLVGLAITDTPASLGTEMLEFSAKAGTNPLAARKEKPENLFTAAEEISLEFSEVAEEKPSLADKVKALFNKQQESQEQSQVEFTADVTEALEEFAAQVEANFVPREEYNDLADRLDNVEKAHADFVEKMSNEPETPARAPATGGDNETVTDC